jgi:hypothetical protein
MRGRAIGLIGLVAGLSAVGVTSAQPPAAKPVWQYAHDLRVRKGGSTDFDKDTPKVGIEVFKDETNGALVAITQTGSLAVLPPGTVGAEKKATWLFAHDLRVRKGDEQTFTKDTTKLGVEVFKDGASGKLLYVCEKGTATFADATAGATDKGPAWHHALVVKVRGPSEEQFTKDTKKYGVEAFKDENTGGLIYVSEPGSIATAPAPAKPPAADQVRAPTALYGLTLRVRKADEPDFTKDTKRYGVEVFRDENTGGLIYVSETGAIATAPSPEHVQHGKGVRWMHAMTLKARPGGVNEFDKANKFGVEVFEDNNTGYVVYVSETGSLAVLPKR